jgi:putative selenium metabolism hydrolase
MKLTDAQQEQVITLTCELVRAESRSGQERQAVETAARWMRALGYDEVWIDEYGSVIGRRQGSGPGKNLHFDGHIDIVTATAPESWRYPPFSGQIADGRIWGRGATDMKGPLAAMICALAFVPQEAFRGTLTMSASVGEEGWEGAALAAILRQHPADAVVIGEPTSLALGFAQKGRAGITVKAKGRAAHTSVPERGINAVYRMFEAVGHVRAVPLPEDEVLGRGVMELIEIISSPYPGDTIVPDGCQARFDRRLVSGETPATMLEGVREALREMDGTTAECPEIVLPCYTGAELRMQDFRPAWVMASDHELIQAALAAMQAEGLAETLLAAPYCTNGSLSAGEMGIPTIIFGPSESALAHIVDEHIEIEKLLRGTGAFAAIAQGYLG